MMSEIMMEYPSISYYSCMESIDHLENTIENGKSKSLHMLMVVIPCTNESFNNDREREVERQKEDTFNVEIHKNIEDEISHKKYNW